MMSGSAEDSEMERELEGLGAVHIMEAWLATTNAEAAIRSALVSVLSCEGGGSHGRNFPTTLVEQVCCNVMSHLPAPLRDHLPEPDQDFIHTALAKVMPAALKGGFADEESMSTATQVVLLQLATTADLLRQLMHAKEGGSSEGLPSDLASLLREST